MLCGVVVEWVWMIIEVGRDIILYWYFGGFEVGFDVCVY